MTGGGPGLVAVGWDLPNVAVWTSVDGLAWSLVPNDETVFGRRMGWGIVNVTAGGPGLVAVGEAVCTSVDGIAWSRLPSSELDWGTGWSVIAAGPGLVATGDIGSDAAVWVAATD